MISNVLSVIAAPPPVSEKHAPAAAATAPVTAPAAPHSFASMLQRGRGEAAKPETAKGPPAAESAPEPVSIDVAGEAPAVVVPRARDAVEESTVKTSGVPWIEAAGFDRTTDGKRPVLRRDEEAATGLPAAGLWLPAPPAARPAPGEAAADASARGHAAMAPTAALPAAPTTELVTTSHRDDTVAAAVPADGTAPPFSVGAAPATAPATAEIEVATVAAPVGTPDFAEALAVQVSVLVGADVQHAELHLNPADMGPVSVQIVVDGSQARIDFGADLAATRQAIEASLPELASALQEAGMTLHGGGVSQHASDRHRADTPAGPGSPVVQRSGGDEQHVPAAAPRRVAIAGAIDLYA